MYIWDAVLSTLPDCKQASSQGQQVLCPFSTPCQIITPLVEIAIWLPNPNPTPNPNPSPTPNPKPTNTRGVIISYRDIGKTIFWAPLHY